MTMTASSIQAGFEPIPGYILRGKLGSGGFGEVWLADAPGGLKKAIKFVHGNVEGEHASSELKSLQRVRQVNHPFILSLERIEVIDGQLIIVTELAQGSLFDRYMEFREKGFVGIVRERLLGYMRDSADGLDFLCQQHDLQHLDVKPANLLLVADRVKVADFGLIKDIQSNSLSVMGGLTPTYAAPEMFDGKPGRFSDQYSLAIVYQELLTGTLPFRGRTTAQLANEHLNKAPNLEAVPLVERPILSKALAKKPSLRFSDCREFVNAIERAHLQTGTHSEVEKAKNAPNKLRPSSRLASGFQSPRPVPAKKESTTGDSLARSHPDLDKSVGHSTVNSIPCVGSNREIETLPPLSGDTDSAGDTFAGIPLPDAGTGERRRKSLVVGLGGTGAKTLMAIRRNLIAMNPDELENQSTGFLFTDSDPSTIEMVVDPDRKERLSYASTVAIPLKTPQYYRQSDSQYLSQLSRRWVYNIPRSLKTEGVRPLGMLAFLDNVPALFDALQETISEVGLSHSKEHIHEPIDFRIVSSAHGGTGSAIVSEVGFLIRQIAAEFGIPVEIELILTCATPNGNTASDLTTASALACLTEINHYFRTEGLHPSLDLLPPSAAIHQPPFDHVTLIHGGQCGNRNDWEDATTQAADYVVSCIQTDLGIRISKSRGLSIQDTTLQTHAEWTPWLSTVQTRSIEIATQLDPEVAASRICLRAILPWLAALNEVSADSSHTHLEPDSLDNKLLEQMDYFVGDMFRSNRWTAQAWVRECMLCVISEDSDSSSPETSTQNPVPEVVDSQAMIDVDQLQELEQVCEQLALEVDEASRLISNLVTTTHESLVDWLVEKWLVKPSAWGQLKPVLRSIASKFSVNANSLFVVSQRLAEKHDAILENLYNGSLKASPEFDQQLHAVALEARFHSLAAKMLGRLAEHMAYVEDLWSNEFKWIQEEICDWIDGLTSRLGTKLDSSPQSNAFLSSIMQCEGDDLTSREVRKSLQSLVSLRLRDSVTHNPTNARAVDHQDTFSEIWELALKNLTKVEVPLPLPSEELQIEPSNGTSPSTDRPVASVPATQTILGNSTDPAATQGSIVRQNLDHEIDSSRPYFVEFGGAVRNIVVMPGVVAEQIDPMQKLTIEKKKVALVVSNRVASTSIVCIGERLVLSDIMERVWMPSSDIWNLANRVYARVDVEWQPVVNGE